MQYAPGLLYFSECVCMHRNANNANTNTNTNTNYNISFNTNTMSAEGHYHGLPADTEKRIMIIFRLCAGDPAFSGSGLAAALRQSPAEPTA